jgi:hypothetical protein
MAPVVGPAVRTNPAGAARHCDDLAMMAVLADPT